MMTSNPHVGEAPGSRLLLCELADFVRQSVAGYPFPSPEGKWLDCRVYLHGVPDEMEDAIYPFVVVRWVEGDIESEKDGKTVLRDEVALILGVNSPRSQAEAGLLCAELLDCLRRALWKKRIIASRFELVEPIRASIPGVQQQVHQYHLATVETVWNYVWPPKALEEAGLSQLRNGHIVAGSYSWPDMEEHKIS